MALIKCPDCKKKVSEQAEKCIHCGCPLNKENKEPTKKSSNKITLIIIIVVVLILTTLIILNELSQVKVPSLSGTLEAEAKEIAKDNNLIPKIEYKNSDKVEEGKVISTTPKLGEKVKKNSSLKIYVSKGPKKILSEDSTIEWYNINGYSPDKWNFEAPYIEDNYLHINCTTTFGSSFSWVKNGLGEASTTEDFYNKVPIKFTYKNVDVLAEESQDLQLSIPLENLYYGKPNNVYVRLYYYDYYGDQAVLNISFNISW